MKIKFASVLLISSMLVSPAFAENVQVIIKNNAFNPSSVTIPAGGTVTWINKDADQHSVIDENGHFRASIGTNGSFTTNFSDPGTRRYHDSLNPGMEGTVIVTNK